MVDKIMVSIGSKHAAMGGTGWNWLVMFGLWLLIVAKTDYGGDCHKCLGIHVEQQRSTMGFTMGN